MKKTIKESKRIKNNNNNNKMCQPHYLKYSLYSFIFEFDYMYWR